MAIKQRETVPDEFMTDKDHQYLTEIVADWLLENEYDPISFTYKIEVEWFE